MRITTIQVTVEVRDLLRRRGQFGESYDDVIRRLLIATRGDELLGIERVSRPTPVSSRKLFPRRQLP